MSEATAKQRAALWVAVVFLLGVLLGGVVGYVFAHHPVSANARLSPQERRARKVRRAHTTWQTLRRSSSSSWTRF